MQRTFQLWAVPVLVFTLLMSGPNAAPVEIGVLDLPLTGFQPSRAFTVRFQGRPVRVWEVGSDIHLCWFAAAAGGELEIETPPRSRDWTISPQRDVSARWSGNRARLRMATPGRLLVHRLPEPGPILAVVMRPTSVLERPSLPGGVIDVATWGLNREGKGNPDEQVVLFRQAAQQAARRRALLVLPAGVYRGSRWEIPGGVTLWMDPGAVLQASIYGYAVWLTGDDIHILGPGVIDGRTNRLHLLGSEGNRRITLRESIYINDAQTAVFFSGGEDLVLEHLTVLSNNAEGADGVDLDSVKNVRARDLLVVSSDDCLAFHSAPDIPTEGVRVWGGLYANTRTGGAYKFANIERAPFLRDVVFENETVVWAATHALALMAVQGARIESIT